MANAKYLLPLSQIPGSTPVYNVQFAIPLCPTSIWGYNNRILPVTHILFYPFQHSRFSIKIIDRDVKETLKTNTNPQ